MGRLLAWCPPRLRGYWDHIHSSHLAYRFSYGAFWSLVGGTVSRILGLASSVLVARMLNREVFGELGVIQSTIGLFGTFAGFGLGTTASKYIAEFRLKDPGKAGRIMALSGLAAWGTGGLMALLLIILAPWLAVHTLAAPQLAPLLRIAAILLCVSSVNGAQTGALTGFEAFREIARVNLVTGVCSFPLMVGCVFLGGKDGAVWGMVLSMALSCLVSNRAIRAECKRAGIKATLRGCLSEWKVLWSFSLPATLSGVLVGPVNWVCNMMLVNRANGYAEMGLFNAANQWFGALMFLPGIFSQALLPMLSERLGQGDRIRAGKILWMAMRINLVVVFPLLLIGSLASPFIMGLYGKTFEQGWPTLIVVLLTAGLFAAQTPVGEIIAASGRMWLGCAMNAGWAVVFIGTTSAFIGLGALGLAGGRCVAYAVHAIWTFWFAYLMIRKINFSNNAGAAPSV